MANAPARKMTYEEYQAFERASETKHEFVDGVVYAMSGGTFSHNAVASNVIIQLGAALRGSPCRPLTSDMRIRTPQDRAFYPDVSVVCGPPQLSDASRDELLNPSVIVEVLSPSTERYDRGDKFRFYRAIPSLREYVLVATSAARVEVFSRQDDGSWVLRSYESGATIELASIRARISVDSLYEGAELEPSR